MSSWRNHGLIGRLVWRGVRCRGRSLRNFREGSVKGDWKGNRKGREGEEVRCLFAAGFRVHEA